MFNLINDRLLTETIMKKAIKQNDLEFIKNNLKIELPKHGNLLSEIDGGKYLIESVENNNYEMTQLILSLNNGYKVKHVLNLAIKNNFYEITKLLMENGYNPNDCIHSPIKSSNNVKMIKLIIKYGMHLNNRLLEIPIIYDKYKIVRLLLSYKLDINYIYNDGDTFLIHYIKNNNNIKLKMIKIFINHNTKVNHKNCKGNSAIFYVIDNKNNYKSFKYLIQFCDLKIRNGIGNTIIHMLTFTYCYRYIKLLLKLNRNILYYQNNYGELPYDIIKDMPKMKKMKKLLLKEMYYDIFTIIRFKEIYLIRDILYYCYG